MSKIKDYAVVGDCHTAALISREGSLDWLCWGRFDRPAMFAALLDPRAGHWSLRPKHPFWTERRYLPGTNVLETRFETASGTLVLTDFMPAASEEERKRLLRAERELLRRAACERGEVELEMEFSPAPGFGSRHELPKAAGRLGWRLNVAGGLLALNTDMPLSPRGDGLFGTARLRAGGAVRASLTYTRGAPAVYRPLEAWVDEALDQTTRWWSSWSQALRFEGPERPAVERSALTLRLLVYAPSGAIVAAPTTSLPERPGGDLNWDYRFCWLRDASLTVRAFEGLDCRDESQAFVTWLLHSTKRSQPALKILYDVHGNAPVVERELRWLAGYGGARPAREGNAAHKQLQLDVYGEVVEAAARLALTGWPLDRETRRLLRGLGQYVCKNWSVPDEGIWEPRSGRSVHTHSRALCWSALDLLAQLHERGLLPEAPAEEYREQRDRIRRELLEKAWNPALESYVAEPGGDAVDASLLRLAATGFEKPDSPRMRKTYALIRRRLDAGGGLLYRNRGEDTAGEGAFGICGFWAAEYLAAGGGTLREAESLFQTLMRYSNDLGLFAEETDPASGDALGNFPQGFTHIGVINAALSLEKRRKGEGPQEPGKAGALRS